MDCKIFIKMCEEFELVWRWWGVEFKRWDILLYFEICLMLKVVIWNVCFCYFFKFVFLFGGLFGFIVFDMLKFCCCCLCGMLNLWSVKIV